jgi:hypothetical protein
MLGELKDSLANRGLELIWDENLRQYLVKKAYSITYGARNLRRTIQRDLEDPIAEKIIDSFETPFALIEVHVADDQIVLDALAFAHEAEGILDDIKAAADFCNSYLPEIYKKVVTAGYQTEKEIEDRLNRYEEEEEEGDGAVEEEDTIYTSNNGNIVAVTYGGKNGNDQEAYKTFILNYNNYAVTVKYEVGGQVRIYTIPANEYVVVIH